jgi:hypothetical protein
MRVAPLSAMMTSHRAERTRAAARDSRWFGQARLRHGGEIAMRMSARI